MSIQELFKEDSKNNVNHHIKCYSLDTKTFSTDTFSVSNLTTTDAIINELTVNDSVKAPVYTINDTGSYNELNVYTIERQVGNRQYAPTINTPSIDYYVKGDTVGNSQPFLLKAGRIYKIKYICSISPGSANTNHTFKISIGGVNIFNPLVVQTPGTTAQTFKIDAHVIINSNDDGQSAIGSGNGQLQIVGSGAGVAVFDDTYTIPTQNYKASIDIFYNYTAINPPTSFYILDYYVQRIA